MAQDPKIAEFNRNRDAMLRRMDLKELYAYFATRAWKPTSDEVCLAAAHKAILEINNFTDEEKEASRQWLLTRGYRQRYSGGPI